MFTDFDRKSAKCISNVSPVAKYPVEILHLLSVILLGVIRKLLRTVGRVIEAHDAEDCVTRIGLYTA